MRILGITLVCGIVLTSAPAVAAPPDAGKVRSALTGSFPGARVTYDSARGLRRITGIRVPLAASSASGRVSAVLSQVAPAAWPGLDLRASDIRIQTSRAFSRLDAGLVLEGRPVLDARLILEVRRDGTLVAIGSSLPPVAGVVHPDELELPDETLRKAACAAIRAERPGAPCPTGTPVRRLWYRTPDGMLRPGAMVPMTSPTLDRAPEVLLDAGGKALWTRDRVRH